MTVEHWATRPIGEPWLSFLREIDRALKTPVTLHCIGGFALNVLIDMPRPTGDIDFVEMLPPNDGNQLLDIGGEGSSIAEKYSLYLQHVTIVDSPCDYADRLIDATPIGLVHLQLYVLDPYDLILTKAQRNSPTDLDDARLVVEQLQLDKARLWNRFKDELLPYLAVTPKKTAFPVRLWLDELFA